MLGARVATPRTMVLIRARTPRPELRWLVLCICPDQRRSVCKRAFPATETDTSTPIGAAENAGDIRTRDLSTFLFPNAFLFNGNPNNCCVIGFHTYDLEPAARLTGFARTLRAELRELGLTWHL